MDRGGGHSLFSRFAAGQARATPQPSRARETQLPDQPHGLQQDFITSNWQEDVVDNHINHGNDYQTLANRPPLLYRLPSSTQTQPISYPQSQGPPTAAGNRISLPPRGNFSITNDNRPSSQPRLQRGFVPAFSQPQFITTERNNTATTPSLSDDFDMLEDDDELANQAPSLSNTQTPKTYRDEVLQTPSRPPRIQHDSLFQSYGPHQPNLLKVPVRHSRNAISLGHAPKLVNGVELVPKHRLPDRFQSVFEYDMFNAVQSKCFDRAFEGGDNMVLCAPTGSGKTVVMELAVCRLIGSYQPGTFKVVYLAPTKSLCSERKRDWSKKFAPLGIQCAELTGDTDHRHLANVKSGDIIITTPEKWDSVTRKWHDHRKLCELVRLFMIDEAHILKDDRGAILEVVVSRMKTIGKDVRFIAVSATVPNPYDLSAWLGKNPENRAESAHEACFEENFRPVKLEKIILGYKCDGNNFVFGKLLDTKIMDVIQNHSAKKPIIVFCATRKECEATAKLLAESWEKTNARDRAWNVSSKRFSFKNKELDYIGKSGVAFHHAGLDAADRGLIERLYLEGALSVICCTSTLAVGINLPAHLVVLKGTQAYNEGQLKEYDDIEILQMLGRAGRPQFDDSAVAVIMTKKENEDYYKKMVSGSEKLESCLHKNLPEHLNAEIGLGTITDIEDAKRWLKSTFLFVRMKSNPAFYQLAGEDVEAKLEKMAERDIESLQEMDLVSFNGTKLKVTDYGYAMASYYIQLETMKTMMNLKYQAKWSDILMWVSEAKEFKEIRFRVGEKSFYKAINTANDMRCPIKTDISTAAHKVNILIQFETGGMQLPSDEKLLKNKQPFFMEKAMVFQHVHRVFRCLIDILTTRKDAVSAWSAMEVSRSVAAKAWENTPAEIRQLDGFGPALLRKFVSQNIKTLEMMGELDSGRIEMIAGRNPTFGAKVKQEIERIPKFSISGKVTKVLSGRGSPVKVTVSVTAGLLNTTEPSKWKDKLIFVTLLAVRSDGWLADFRRIPAYKLKEGKSFVFETEILEWGQKICCRVACEEIVGTMKSVDIDLGLTKDLFPQKAAVQKPILQQLRQVAAPLNSSSTQTQTRSTERSQSFTSAKSLLLNRAGEDDYSDEILDQAIGDIDFSHIDNFAGSILEQETKKNTASNTKLRPKIDDGSESDTENEKYIIREDGTKARECSHHCKDKKSCKHYCCQNGVDVKEPKRKRKAAPKPDGEDSNMHLKDLINKSRHLAEQRNDLSFKKPSREPFSPPPTKKVKASVPKALSRLTNQSRIRLAGFKSGEIQNRPLIPREEDIKFVDLPSSPEELVPLEEILNSTQKPEVDRDKLDAPLPRRNDNLPDDLGFSGNDFPGDDEEYLTKDYRKIPRKNSKSLSILEDELGEHDRQEVELNGQDPPVLERKDSRGNITKQRRNYLHGMSIVDNESSEDISLDISSIPLDDEMLEILDQADSTDMAMKPYEDDPLSKRASAETEEIKREFNMSANIGKDLLGPPEDSSLTSPGNSFEAADVMDFLGNCFELVDETD